MVATCCAAQLLGIEHLGIAWTFSRWCMFATYSYLQCYDCRWCTKALVMGDVYLGFCTSVLVKRCRRFMCFWVREDHATPKPQSFTECFSNLTPAIMNFHSWARRHANHQSCFKLASVCGVAGLDLRSDRTAPLVDTIYHVLRICCNLVEQAQEGLNLHQELDKSKFLVYFFVLHLTCLGWYLWYLLIFCDALNSSTDP